MIKRPFFGLSRPKLEYPEIQIQLSGPPKEIPLPSKVTLLFETSIANNNEPTINVKDQVKTGQKIMISKDGDGYLVSTVSGTVSIISDFIGYLGRKYTSITIETTPEDNWSDDCADAIKSEAFGYLGHLPGNKDFTSKSNSETSLETIVINGIDKDLLVNTNQYILKNRIHDLQKGIEHIKRITNVDKILLMIPPTLKSGLEQIGIEARVVNPIYPSALPELIMNNIMGITVPAGKTPRDLGVGFLSAEFTAAIGRTLEQERVPVTKVLTVIDKNHKTTVVEARVGTPVKAVLKALEIDTDQGDRLILGGPMTGLSVYTEDMPILFDTDAVMVQDGSEIVQTSDTPCINCGECVRVCPTKVPVNMLVRLLENGLYEEAADEYNLLSCIECGLCSYVCVAKIPLFQYIMLGKHEISMIKSTEESNA